jgi:hypothetical protein
MVRDMNADRKPRFQKSLLALLLVAPVMAGCSGGSMSDMFSSDLLSKDAQWFSRTGRLSISNVSIETPPLTPNARVTSDDMVSAEGFCPGMGPPAGANALTDGAAGAPPPVTTGTVALGHTECDVVRGIGAPQNVSLSNNPRGDRVAVVTYAQGPRAGIYTFTGGRLTSIERGPEQAAPPRVAAKPKKKKPAPAPT